MITGSIPMVAHRRFLVAAALVAMAVQLTLTAAGTLVACANTQHTHNGRPAPDCPMHHALSAGSSLPSGHEHHHHSGPQRDAGARLACGCSSDIPAFLIVGSALVSTPVSVAQPASIEVTPSVATTMPLERFAAPLTPPPRLTLA
jgi:hypothetical protein